MVRRFEIVLPAERREALDDLAAQIDSTASELARLGICWVLANKELLVKGRPPAALVAA
jgi:hypothetical protein